MSNTTTNNEQGARIQPTLTLNLDQLNEGQTKRQSMSFGKLFDVERRIKAGQPVSDEERSQHADAQAAFEKAVKGIRETFAEVAKQLQPIQAKFLEISHGFFDWQKEIAKQLAPWVSQMRLAFENMPPKIRSALLSLGERGWYLDGDLGFSEVLELDALIANGDLENADDLLIGHFEARLSKIEDELVKAMPHRGKILRSAFAAHRRDEFELSVPVFLAQADGACLALTGSHFFMTANGAPKVAPHVTNAALDAITAALLSPLATMLPINATEKERERRMRDQGLSTWIALNRHLVLHGESLDYGTQINSLKAISLINYIVSFLQKVEKPEVNLSSSK